MIFSFLWVRLHFSKRACPKWQQVWIREVKRNNFWMSRASVSRSYSFSGDRNSIYMDFSDQRYGVRLHYFLLAKSIIYKQLFNGQINFNLCRRIPDYYHFISVRWERVTFAELGDYAPISGLTTWKTLHLHLKQTSVEVVGAVFNHLDP